MKNIALVLSAALLFGCNGGLGFKKKSDSNKDGEALPRARGCLAGVVEDGITGARVDLAAGDNADNFFVLVSDSQKFADPLLSDGQAADSPNLVGEYTLCDVPVEAEFPLYVAVPGYQPFESVVLIASSRAASGSEAHQDVLSQIPTLQANIRLFPAAPAGKDYQVVVSFNGAAVEGAAVQLIPTGGHVTPISGANYLDPVVTGYKTLQGTTDASGVATFPAAQLALGARYHYLVIPVDSSTQGVADGTVTVGYVLAPSDPYALHVDLADTTADLVIVSKSTDANSHDETGALKVVFNKPVELVPDSVDGAVATLDHAVQAALVDDVPGNNASEQVTVAISGQTVTLTPKFKTSPAKAKEAALGITYSGISVRSTTGQKQVQKLQIAGTVKFYGGKNASPPTTVAANSGNNQSGDPGAMLDAPIAARVLDADAAPVAGVTVNFAVASGGGSVGAATAITDANGIAQTTWTLGTTGAQQVTASVTGIATPATFTATFSIATLTIDTGNNQTGFTTAPLADPIVVIAKDAANNIVVGGQVTFTVVNTTNGGKLRMPGTTGAGQTTYMATTNASGQAEAEWLMGAVAGTYSISAAAGDATPVTFSATSIAATLAKTSGDAQTANTATVVTNPLIVTVTDGTNPLQNVVVKFTPANAGGMCGATSGTANQTTFEATTDASGHAQAYWKLGTTSGAQAAAVQILDATSPPAVTFTATAN